MPGLFHRVDRPFSGGGVTRIRGEAVNPDQWRNGRRLVDQRYLSPGAIGVEPVACGCGRHWAEEVQDHDCTLPEATLLEVTPGLQAPSKNRKAV